MADLTEQKSLNTSASPKLTSPTGPNKEPVSLMISGSHWGIKVMIHTLFKCGIASVDAWSKPQQIPGSDKFMSITTKHIQKPGKARNLDTSDS